MKNFSPSGNSSDMASKKRVLNASLASQYFGMSPSSPSSGPWRGTTAVVCPMAVSSRLLMDRTLVPAEARDYDRERRAGTIRDTDKNAYFQRLASRSSCGIRRRKALGETPLQRVNARVKLRRSEKP